MQWLINLILKTLKSKVVRTIAKAKKIIETSKKLGAKFFKKDFPKTDANNVLAQIQSKQEYLKQLQKQEQKLLAKQERERQYQVKQLEKMGERERKRLDKWFEKKAKENPKKERRYKDNETGVELLFNSSWIKWGMFVHYWTKKRKDGNGYYKSRNGVMLLKLYNTKSKYNPSLIYQWIKVKYSDWTLITQDKTGTNFWNVWYHRNRKNQRHLTMFSKYFNPQERIKQELKEFSKWNTKEATIREKARLSKYYGKNRRF